MEKQCDIIEYKTHLKFVTLSFLKEGGTACDNFDDPDGKLFHGFSFRIDLENMNKEEKKVVTQCIEEIKNKYLKE